MLSCLYSLAYTYGCRRHKRVALWSLPVVLALVLVLIQDLDRPNDGAITVQPHLMLQLRQSLDHSVS
jgi:hypothetical protein